jgi:acyl-coenzyme A thioesterase PaaI-like protein
VARVRRSGKRTIVVQVDVVDAGDSDRLCAVATVSFAVLRPRRL